MSTRDGAVVRNYDVQRVESTPSSLPLTWIWSSVAYLEDMFGCINHERHLPCSEQKLTSSSVCFGVSIPADNALKLHKAIYHLDGCVADSHTPHWAD